MLDSAFRPYLVPSLDKIAEKLDAANISANLITLGALGAGLVGCFFVAIQSYLFGLVFIIASRIIAGLAGSIARRRGASDFGAFLHTVCNLVFYAAFIFFFVMTLDSHKLAGLFVLFSLFGLFGTRLAFDVISAGYDMTPEDDSKIANLIESTEVILFMVLACLAPSAFSAIAFLFGLLCWVATLARILQAWSLFGQSDAPAASAPDEQSLS